LWNSRQAGPSARSSLSVHRSALAPINDEAPPVTTAAKYQITPKKAAIKNPSKKAATLRFVWIPIVRNAAGRPTSIATRKAIVAMVINTTGGANIRVRTRRHPSFFGPEPALFIDAIMPRSSSADPALSTAYLFLGEGIAST